MEAFSESQTARFSRFYDLTILAAFFDRAVGKLSPIKTELDNRYKVTVMTVPIARAS